MLSEVISYRQTTADLSRTASLASRNQAVDVVTPAGKSSTRNWLD